MATDLPANVDVTAVFENVPDDTGVLLEEMSDVDLFGLISGEGYVQLGQSAVLFVLFQLVWVQEVLILLAASVVQDGLANRATFKRER